MKMDHRQFFAYQNALSDVGIREIPGPRHNPAIVEMFEKVGAPWFDDDETAWCGAYQGAQFIDHGLPALPNGKSVTARAWHHEEWGVAVDIEQAPAGALIVLRRGDYNGNSGHVAQLHRLVRKNGKVVGFFLVGGNQSNSVSNQYYDRYDSKGRDLLLSARIWPSEGSKPGLIVPETAQEFSLPAAAIAVIIAIVALIFG